MDVDFEVYEMKIVSIPSFIHTEKDNYPDKRRWWFPFVLSHLVLQRNSQEKLLKRKQLSFSFWNAFKLLQILVSHLQEHQFAFSAIQAFQEE